MSKKRTQREEPCLICGHYHDYEAGQPCGICGHVMASDEVATLGATIPTPIIPGFLYLGSYDSASRPELLKTMGITHILNLPGAVSNTFTYHNVADSPPPFDECLGFIDHTSQQPNSKVLLYCMTGTSRSPSIAIAYLMKTRGWRLAESYKWVKGKRDKVLIKPDEEQRLKEFEASLHGGSSVPLGLAALNNSCGAFLSSADVGAPRPPAQESQGFTAPAAQPQPSSGAPSFGAVFSQPQWSMSSAPATQPLVFGGGGGGSSQPPTFGAQQQQQQQQVGGAANSEMEM